MMYTVCEGEWHTHMIISFDFIVSIVNNECYFNHYSLNDSKCELGLISLFQKT